MEYTLSDLELMDICLTAINGRNAPLNLTSRFSNFPDGTQHRIQTLMVGEGVIELVAGNIAGKRYALITVKGSSIMAKYGSFSKYWKKESEDEKARKKKEVDAEAREERNTIANELSAKSSKINIILTTLRACLKFC
jgi:hypothetical protein